MNKEAKVLMASFIYFATIIEQNGGDIPPKLKKLYAALKAYFIEENKKGNK